MGSAFQDDPQVEADVQALYDAGTIRLMASGGAAGRRFYEPMPAPLDVPAEVPPVPPD